MLFDKFFSLKFIYSEKAAKFCEIFILLLSYIVPVKSKVKILQDFVAFSEYMNFSCDIFKNISWHNSFSFIDATFRRAFLSIFSSFEFYFLECRFIKKYTEVFPPFFLAWKINTKSYHKRGPKSKREGNQKQGRIMKY